jgi:hypothetical protein
MRGALREDCLSGPVLRGTSVAVDVFVTRVLLAAALLAAVAAW